jgi:sarcosine oxidase, subunit gamma
VSDASHSRNARNADGGSAPITLRPVTFAVAWNVKGDPRDPAFAAAASRTLASSLPLEPMTSARDGDRTLLWLGPRTWLYVSNAPSRQDAFDTTRREINAAGGALFDVSASYVAWQVCGAPAACVLNRACPLDLHPRAFAPGRCAQSVLRHINALFYRPDEESSFIVMVARSFADDAWHTLCEAATSDGYRIANAATFASASRAAR